MPYKTCPLDLDAQAMRYDCHDTQGFILFSSSLESCSEAGTAMITCFTEIDGCHLQAMPSFSMDCDRTGPRILAS